MQKAEQTIQEWIDHYTSILLGKAIYLVSNKEDAEDIVQDVFVAAFQSFSSFQEKSKPLTWLMSILQKKTADFYRKKYRHPDQISISHFFDETGSWKSDDVLQDWSAKEENILDNTDFNETMDDCLEALPPKWKIPVKLYYLGEKKANEVCQETGITTTNLWKILQRSRLQLRECLEFNWFNPQN